MVQIDYYKICNSLEKELENVFEELMSWVTEREDSRAFWAMIEKKITSNRDTICNRLWFEAIENPWRRTIYDFACKINWVIVWFDVKTKDLDSTKYSDWWICAVWNLLKFMANDKWVFMVVEFWHTRASEKTDARDLEYIKVAPFHILPEDSYRIESLWTWQVRLNYTINQVIDEVDWNREYSVFFDIFTSLCITHYERVWRDANKRKESIERFRDSWYERFQFSR